MIEKTMLDIRIIIGVIKKLSVSMRMENVIGKRLESIKSALKK